MVVRRGEKTRNDQLSYVASREGRSFLRADFRHHQGLGVLLRQIQVDPIQGRDLRQMRCRGDTQQGPARADGACGTGRPRGAYLVLPQCSQPDGASAQSDDQPAQEHSIFREIRDHRPGRIRSRTWRTHRRGRIPRVFGRIQRQIPGHDRRRCGEGTLGTHRH